MKTKLLLSALSLLGFSGCSDSPCMYGTPLVYYHVGFTGEVKDEAGEPIKDIDVEIHYTDKSIKSDDNGAFETDFVTKHSIGYVSFTDNDGDENGGDFATKTVSLDWDDATKDGSRRVFDLGTVTLEKKTEEITE